MTLLTRAGTAALVAATFAFGASATNLTANAAPAAVNSANHMLSTDANVTKVDDRREWRGRGGHGGNWNRGRGHNGFGNVAPYIGLGIAGAIIGDALSEDAYGNEEGPGYAEGSSGARERCASQFRSFEWDTGLYTTYQGDKRLCPYLG